ncbi:hypothetical protein L3Q82_017586, partial [Scortum barcoo]
SVISVMLSSAQQRVFQTWAPSQRCNSISDWEPTGDTKILYFAINRLGVIVPCNDSPVHTPIFPVKKVRDEGAPTEWRFVQDLQAVNAAVQP